MQGRTRGARHAGAGGGDIRDAAAERARIVGILEEVAADARVVSFGRFVEYRAEVLRRKRPVSSKTAISPGRSGRGAWYSR